MRRGFDGLALWRVTCCNRIPSGHLFVFGNKRADRVKSYWDRSGFCLWYKRASKGLLPFP
ncbi:IS66 family insertion sequence element accessory protein TnpB [bacterium]|nr:IS66 family insertion sequence element accessory protein TnpB [bacterium]